MDPKWNNSQQPYPPNYQQPPPYQQQPPPYQQQPPGYNPIQYPPNQNFQSGQNPNQPAVIPMSINYPPQGGPSFPPGGPQYGFSQGGPGGPPPFYPPHQGPMGYGPPSDYGYNQQQQVPPLNYGGQGVPGQDYGQQPNPYQQPSLPGQSYGQQQQPPNQNYGQQLPNQNYGQQQQLPSQYQNNAYGGQNGQSNPQGQQFPNQPQPQQNQPKYQPQPQQNQPNFQPQPQQNQPNYQPQPQQNQPAYQNQGPISQNQPPKTHIQNQPNIQNQPPYNPLDQQKAQNLYPDLGPQIRPTNEAFDIAQKLQGFQIDNNPNIYEKFTDEADRQRKLNRLLGIEEKLPPPKPVVHQEFIQQPKIEPQPQPAVNNLLNPNLPKPQQHEEDFINASEVLGFQDFEEIYKAAKKLGRSFQDPDFPHDNSSLMEKSNSEKTDEWRDIKWLRPSEFLVGKYSIFSSPDPNDRSVSLRQSCISVAKGAGGIQIDDVFQGSLGDCYFLSSLSSLAEKPDRIRRLFISKKANETCGVYCVKRRMESCICR